MNKRKKYNIWVILFLKVVTLCIIYILSEYFTFRIDLTKEGRYSISNNTKVLLKKLKTNYKAEIYLSGDLPYGFYKLKEATIEILNELDKNSNRSIKYKFPKVDFNNSKEVNSLINRGLSYTSVNIKNKDNKLTRQLLFPSLVLHNKKNEVVVNLLNNNPALSGQENINSSIACLEYELTNALRMLEKSTPEVIAFLDGHGELPVESTIDFAKTLAENYQVKRLKAKELGDNIKALIIAQPRKSFNEEDKFAIDQYIMNGGKVLWMVDQVEISKDSLRHNKSTMAYYQPLSIEDQLFTYGVRINPDLVLDLNADLIKINTALKGNKPRFTPLPWAYAPLLETSYNSPITKGLAPVRAMFANSIDTLKSINIKKTILLRTSSATRIEKVPRMISMQEIEKMQNRSFYTHSNTAVAVLLEGVFPSVFKGRLAYSKKDGFKEESIINKMIVVADGDIICNETRNTGSAMQFLPLGYNSDYKYLHGNKLFLLNAIDYLCDDEGWLELRNKEYHPALLDKIKARSGRIFWQVLNVCIPLFLVILVSLSSFIFRRRKNRK